MKYGLLRAGLVGTCFAASLFGANSVTYVEDTIGANGCGTPTPYTVVGTCVSGSVTNPLTGAADTAVTAEGVTNFTTTGGNMNGMTVEVFFSDGKSVTGTWAATNTISGGTNGTVVVNGTTSDKFSITQMDSTFTTDGTNNNDTDGGFHLTNNSTSTATITGVILVGNAGSNANCAAGTAGNVICGTLFDRTSIGGNGTGTTNEGTLSSNIGLDFQIDNGSGSSDNGNKKGTFNILATYSNPFNLVQNPACDYTTQKGDTKPVSGACLDEFGTLTIQFQAASGPAAGATFSFDQDTDTTTSGPEPGTSAMLGTGLLAGMLWFLISRKGLRKAFASRRT